MRTGIPLTTGGSAFVDLEDGGRDHTVCVVGVRGGVGTSTIARALGAADHGADASGLPSGAPVVLVTSPSVDDTHRLLPLVDRCHLRGLTPLVVAVVSDGHGRWPAASRARLRMIRDLAVVVAVPWMGRWRWQGPDDVVSAGWARAVDRLAQATQALAPDRIVVARRSSRRARRRSRRKDTS